MALQQVARLPAGSSSSRHRVPGHLDVEAAEPAARAADVVVTTTRPSVAVDEADDSRRTGATGLSSSRSASSTRTARSGRRDAAGRAGRRSVGLDEVTGGGPRHPTCASCRAATTATGCPAVQIDSATTRSAFVRPGAWRTGHEQPSTVAPGPPGRAAPCAAQPQEHRCVARACTRIRVAGGPGRARSADDGRQREPAPGPPCAGRALGGGRHSRVSAGVGPANCTSRLSCTRTARPGGGSRGASEARSPASATSSGSIAPSRKVLAAIPAHRGWSRLRPPATAPTMPTERPSRSTRTSSPTEVVGGVGGLGLDELLPAVDDQRGSWAADPRAGMWPGSCRPEPPVDLVAQVVSEGRAGPGSSDPTRCRRAGARRGRPGTRGCR